VKQFFSDTKLGVCSLTLYNIALSKGGARLAKSAVTYKVNKKPTAISVEGSVNAGYLYTIAWYDNTFVHVLECANMDYNQNQIMAMTDLSRQVDSELNQR